MSNTSPPGDGRPRSDGGRRALGAFAERVAAGRLAAAGYRIVLRNVHLGVGEIDLVAEKDGMTVLVEVRARREGDLGSALWSLSAGKQQRMRRAAARFLQLHPELPQEARIDLVAVLISRTGRVEAIDIVENAVEG